VCCRTYVGNAGSADGAGDAGGTDVIGGADGVSGVYKGYTAGSAAIVDS
jgi:hypothetical protein